MFPLINHGINLVSTIKQDDLCYGDDQLIAEGAKVWGDIVGIMAKVQGFDKPWDPTLKLEHIKSSDFRKQAKKY